ncbi:MAG: hypothetical protein UX02_C0005G0037 [Candidatus Moranbacteria bacterium GW2011_GWC1_45_18]|nr:MAG: hypothetical protein UT79_C0005G0037 [Candidatus Moranbacteria bacterium GW2011_GWC2_40_12]KKT33067.1 MAG: hypothetical protein UW19_C0012G0039 [Candidatus Moranbacteria bacterium GW2011_GWF2_44_10]KKT99224.1 MAG: hypothetical protein UX02_C0005G0037 [Candidatus Moranbacteria bacterium GW2011_GWC1_45_18]OGI24631.1 MAG: hypothetical protein A2194_03870 [Candidatus Moranbacteria bacterium RIFOXYA1_FULL_44_8]OGI36833.1 MAG: hypothetical protein A2407_05305 [Candidatus Moranbacteria bacteri
MDWQEFSLQYVVEPKEEECFHLGVHISSLYLPDITSGLFKGAPHIRWISNRFGISHPAGIYCPKDVIEVFICQKGWAQIEMHSKERCGVVVLNAEENKGLIVNWEIHRSLTISNGGTLMILSSDNFDYNIREAVKMSFKCHCSESGPDGLMSPEKVAIILKPLHQAILKCRSSRDLENWVHKLDIPGVAIPQTWRERWSSYLWSAGMAVAQFPDQNAYYPEGDRLEILKEIEQFLLTGIIPTEGLQLDGSWYAIGDKAAG